MKRKGNLYGEICSLENLRLADAKARKGKGYQEGVKEHLKNEEANILALHHALISRTYRTSAYTTFTIKEPKERIVSRLPYYPDRIVHHAVMNVLQPIFMAMFTADTYSCIKGKGIHGAARAVRKALGDVPGTQYCLKLDVRKFYPTISHQVLKGLLRRKFKDEDLLWLLDEIIDSAPGLPIGNYLSQYFANFYLTHFDHWIKEVKGIRYYFRYADDIVILAPDKPSLHKLLAEIRAFMDGKLRLEVKDNYQVFPVEYPRGIDFVGYRFYHTHTLLRKTIKKNFARKLAKRPNLKSIVSYYGWIKHCNGNHLLKKLLHEQVQRLQSQRRPEPISGRQGQNGEDTQPTDPVEGFQNRAIEFQGKGMRPTAKTGLHPGNRRPHHLHQLLDAYGNDQKSTGGRLPVHHNDSKAK